MVYKFSNMNLTDDEWIYLIGKTLYSWTEIPLSPLSGYGKDDLKFYDGIIGTLLRHTEQIMRESPGFLNQRFVKSWKYQGKLYRVLHESPVPDARYIDEFRMELPRVDYHGMIAHWTDDYSFAGLMYKLSPEVECIILEADTKDHIAFDVNGFRKEYGFENQYLAGEREIVFPMHKDCITEYRMTINEFVAMHEETKEE